MSVKHSAVLTADQMLDFFVKINHFYFNRNEKPIKASQNFSE